MKRLTRQLVDELVQGVTIGLSLKDVAIHVNVPHEVLMKWFRLGQVKGRGIHHELYHGITKAGEVAIQRHLDYLRASKNPKAKAWLKARGIKPRITSKDSPSKLKKSNSYGN